MLLLIPGLPLCPLSGFSSSITMKLPALSSLCLKYLEWLLLLLLASCTSRPTPELGWPHEWAVRPTAPPFLLHNGRHVLPTSFCLPLNLGSRLILLPSSPKTFPPPPTLPHPASRVKDFPFCNCLYMACWVGFPKTWPIHCWVNCLSKFRTDGVIASLKQYPLPAPGCLRMKSRLLWHSPLVPDILLQFQPSGVVVI